jgi:hypothetical protein
MTEEFDYGKKYPVLATGEAVLWRGKPKKSAFVAAKSLTMLPLAVIWLILDLNFIVSAFSGGEMLLFIIPFFTLHLMPVWIWLGSTITAGRRWRNTNYYVTNRRIIIQGGFLAVNETSLFYNDLRNAQLRIGLFDKLFHTGTVIFDNGVPYYNNRQRQQQVNRLENLEDCQNVYNRIQKVILDIQTDMEYPNAYRPEENPGYNTNYNP